MSKAMAYALPYYVYKRTLHEKVHRHPHPGRRYIYQRNADVLPAGNAHRPPYLLFFYLKPPRPETQPGSRRPRRHQANPLSLARSAILSPAAASSNISQSGCS